MNTEGLTHHTSSRFNEDLERIRASVLEMGGLVERQLREALSGIDSGDSEVIAAVAEQELRINQMERSIDEDCSQVLATRAPGRHGSAVADRRSQDHHRSGANRR